MKYWDMRMLSERGPAGAFEEPEAKAVKRASRSVASIATATEGGRSHGVTCLSLSPQGTTSAILVYTCFLLRSRIQPCSPICSFAHLLLARRSRRSVSRVHGKPSVVLV